MRGIRGAITVKKNEREEIVAAVRWMVTEMCRNNGVNSEDIGACIFSSTEDITACFPATGARQIPGFDMVPLFDARQIAVEGSMPLCIRVLMLVDTEKKQSEIRHVYLGDAVNLRADIVQRDKEERCKFQKR